VDNARQAPVRQTGTTNGGMVAVENDSSRKSTLTMFISGNSRKIIGCEIFGLGSVFKFVD
jgi:hypothetical protein